MDQTQQIINTIKEHKSVLDEDKSYEDIELVIFKIDTISYGFYGRDIKEIIAYNTITFVPGCPETIMGIINVRGDIESVLNLHKIINKPTSPPSRHSRIVLAECDGIRSGILVDSVDDVLTISKHEIFDTISTLDQGIRSYVDCITMYQNNYVPIIDIGKLFQTITNQQQ